MGGREASHSEEQLSTSLKVRMNQENLINKMLAKEVEDLPDQIRK
jgi:hypothetical protein